MNYRSHLKCNSLSIALISLVILLTIFPIAGSFAATLPTLPQVYIDTTYSPPSGNTITVNSGGNLQTALNNAQLGDTIVLQAGSTFTGPFTLPNKTTGSGWIYIISSGYSKLPVPGTRVSPSDASNMPTIVASSGGVYGIKTVANSHHYRFVGIEFKPVTGNFVYNLINIGDGETSAERLPNNIVFDRCYIHGDPAKGGRRGVAMNGASLAVIDSYVSCFKEAGADSQALWSSNSPGPIKIVNNYLEAASENVLFGGDDPKITDLVPSDIEIRKNHFSKPLSWMSESINVKNLLELKNSQRILVERNLFENNWAAAQVGFAILITPRNQNGTAPWSVTKDITFQFNRLFNIGSGINVMGDDDLHKSQRTTRVLIQHNLIEVNGLGGADGRMFQIIRGPTHLSISNNTGFCTGPLSMADNLPKTDEFDFKNNIVTNGSYGFRGAGTNEGTTTLNAWFTNWVFEKNAIIGAYSGGIGYPRNNYFPLDVAAVNFLDLAKGNYRLSELSPYKIAGTDGKDLGAQLDLVPPKNLAIVK